jgi:ABC-2 type transport system permease protein
MADWSRGFPDLFTVESRRWWHTRRWWIHSVVWMGIINGILGIIIWTSTEPKTEIIRLGTEMFMVFVHAFVAIGAVVLVQGAIIGEQQDGTAAWVLSKPVTRPAFVLAKAAATLLPAIITMIALPASVAYLQLSTISVQPVAVDTYLSGLLMAVLHLLFYLSLTFMLGTWFEGRGPVIAIPLAVLFGQSLLSGFLGQAAPWLLILLPGELINAAPAIVLGQDPLTTIASQMIMTLFWCSLFLLIAIWRFNKQEF